MVRHLFRKIGNGPWEDIGSETLDKLRGFMSEEDVITCIRRLGEAKVSGPNVEFEIRDVPDNTEGRPDVGNQTSGVREI